MSQRNNKIDIINGRKQNSLLIIIKIISKISFVVDLRYILQILNHISVNQNYINSQKLINSNEICI